MGKDNENSDINRIDNSRFNKDLEAIISQSEDMRLSHMRKNRTRTFLAMNLSLLFVSIGVAGSGWLFLMEAKLGLSALILIVSVLPPILLNIWAAKPLKTYIDEHKTIFMPKLAKALNGLTFHPQRGVSAKMIRKLAIIPPHDRYKAEDCFMGKYKGVKVIFSEARLYSKRKKAREPVFNGIFVLLETPQNVIEGHTIITSDNNMVKSYEKTRWKNLSKVNISVSNANWDKFHIYSSKPETAEIMVGERLLKELAEAGDIFDNAEITAALFGKKYMFIMIPYEHDMFEPSNLFVPVTTKGQAMRCKKEIEQLLEIIDVFDLYTPPQKIK